MLDDGQPQPGAATGRGAPAINAVEALGQARNMLGRNADAGVLH